MLEFSDCNFSIRGKIQRGFGKVIKEQAHTTNAIRLYGTRLSLPIASRLTAMVRVVLLVSLVVKEQRDGSILEEGDTY